MSRIEAGLSSMLLRKPTPDEAYQIIRAQKSDPDRIITCFRIMPNGEDDIHAAVPHYMSPQGLTSLARYMQEADFIRIHDTTSRISPQNETVQVIAIRRPHEDEVAQILHAQKAQSTTITCKTGVRSVARIPSRDVQAGLYNLVDLAVDMQRADLVEVRAVSDEKNLTGQANHDNTRSVVIDGTKSIPKEVAAHAAYQQSLRSVAEAVARDRNREVPPDPSLFVQLPLPPEPNGLLLPYHASSQMYLFVPHAATVIATRIDFDPQAVVVQAFIQHSSIADFQRIKPTHQFTFDIQNNRVRAERLDGKSEEEFAIFGGSEHPLYTPTRDSLIDFPWEAYKRAPARLEFQTR